MTDSPPLHLQTPDSPMLNPGPQVALAGDWHGDAYWGQKMLDVCAADGIRTVLHLGDFGLWPGYQGTGYLKRLGQHLEKNNQLLYWLDGNHDDHDALEAWPVEANGLRRIRDRIWHLPRGFRWDWHGRTWMALGGAHSVDRQFRTAHADWWPGELISPQEVLVALSGGPVDVLLTHDAPLGIPKLDERLAPNVLGWPQEELDSAYLHQKVLRQVVDIVRPAQIYHGHYHWRYDDELVLPDGHQVRVSGLDCDNTTRQDNLLYVRIPVTTDEETDAQIAEDR